MLSSRTTRSMSNWEHIFRKRKTQQQRKRTKSALLLEDLSKESSKLRVQILRFLRKLGWTINSNKSCKNQESHQKQTKLNKLSDRQLEALNSTSRCSKQKLNKISTPKQWDQVHQVDLVALVKSHNSVQSLQWSLTLSSSKMHSLRPKTWTTDLMSSYSSLTSMRKVRSSILGLSVKGDSIKILTLLDKSNHLAPLLAQEDLKTLLVDKLSIVELATNLSRTSEQILEKVDNFCQLAILSETGISPLT